LHAHSGHEHGRANPSSSVFPLDSEIVLARDRNDGIFHDELRRLFADRVMVWMVGNGDDVTLLGAQAPQAE